MLKATLKARENITIEVFGSIVPYLKNLNLGYRSKKSKVLTRQEIETFLEKAEEKEYLFLKVTIFLHFFICGCKANDKFQVALVLGICGACRKIELYNINFKDIEDRGEVLIVNIPDTKTHKQRKFTVINEGFGINPIDLYRRYVGLRPTNAPAKFFLKYYHGKCSRQVVGINTFGAIPRKIAIFLKLEDPKSYTGHAFRRSSATIFANAGTI